MSFISKYLSSRTPYLSVTNIQALSLTDIQGRTEGKGNNPVNGAPFDGHGICETTSAREKVLARDACAITAGDKSAT